MAFVSFTQSFPRSCGYSWEESIKSEKLHSRQKERGSRGGMCMTQVAAHFPVAPSVWSRLGVSLGRRRWKPSGALIPPGSRAPARGGLSGAGHCSSRFPLTTNPLVCPKGSSFRAGIVEASAPEGPKRMFQRKPMGLGQFPAGTEGYSRPRERTVSEARRAAPGV